MADLGERLKDLGIDVAQTVLKPIEPALDILSRPSYAVSEAYGAKRAGEPVLPAAWRGFWEGAEGAEYGSMGEQLLPAREDDSIGKKLSRFGVDVVSDPLIVAGGPLFRGARAGVGAGLRGVERLSRPARTALAGMPAYQRATRFVRPLGSLPEAYGGPSGGQLSSLMREAQEATTLRLGQETRDFDEKLRALGLHRPRNAQQRMEALNVIETGQRSADPKVNELADWLEGSFKRTGREVEEFRDELGEGFRLFDARTGESRPFSMLQDYVPRMFRADYDEGLEAYLARLSKQDAARVERLLERPDSKFAASLARQLGITTEQAQAIVRQHVMRPKRVGHIERVRRDLDPLLEPLLERDPALLYPRYMENVIRRVETARRFGVEHGKINTLADEAVAFGMDPSIADDVAMWAKGTAPASKLGLDSKLRGLMALQAMGKLGPTTTIANISQTTNTAVAEGIGNTLRALRAVAPRSELRHRFISSYLGGMRDHLRIAVGSADPGGGLGRMARTWLRAVQFERAEEFNRLVSAAAGSSRAEQLAREAGSYMRQGLAVPKRLSDDLARRGVTAKDIGSVMQTGRLTPEAMERIGLRASQKTQHATNYLELPPGWRTPEMRLVTQFKRFALNQTRFLYNEVAQPAYRYFVTDGKEGSLGPLIRALAVYAPAGYGVSWAREKVREMQAAAIGARRKAPSRSSFDKHPTLTTLRNMMYVGSFGMIGDVAERASRGQLAEYAFGPTVSDGFDALERLAKMTQGVAYGEGGPSLEDLLLNAYRYGGRGALGISAPELKTMSTRRGLPGAVHRGVGALLEGDDE